MKRLTEIERFLSKVDRSNGDFKCWIWTAGVSNKGYAIFSSNRVNRQAYRWSYEFFKKKKIKPKMEIDHICRNRKCVNPRHLEEVTHLENVQRKVASRKFCKNGHEFTIDNIIPTYQNPRHKRCKTCHRLNKRKSYLKKTKHIKKRKFSPMREFGKSYL